MLRALFGEPPRQEAGVLKEANQAIWEYLESLSRIPASQQSVQERRFGIWSHSFLRALDELEQSQYASTRYGSLVQKAYIDEMQDEELSNYYRHVFYYKSALVSLFAVLDKLGHFLNERFNLKTEKIKSRYSYFTVLRNMHQNGLYTDLEQMLYDLKVKYKEPVARLRNQRNMEIHTINADLLDDLLKAAEAKYGESLRLETEPIASSLEDLAQGCELALRSVRTVFHYLVHPPAAEKQRQRQQERG